NFLQSQIIWDETMAETVANYIKKNPDRKVIVLAGGGHIRFRYGIPNRVERRTGLRGLTILLDDQMRKGIADYIVYTAHIQGEQEKRLGVVVRETGKGLLIEKVGKGTVAERGGLKEGDIILSFDGKKIKSVSDLKVHLFFSDKKANLKILRKNQTKDIQIEF
ncbi:MAG: PDZ domain-containing protein, partial [Aquificae bacterium]|nr:PDZ domain-containing protein [Aquificota bacterium]